MALAKSLSCLIPKLEYKQNRYNQRQEGEGKREFEWDKGWNVGSDNVKRRVTYN